MERRNFLKTGFMAICMLCGFVKNTQCFAEEKLLAADQSSSGSLEFNGIYYGTLQDGRMMLPDAFNRKLMHERLAVVVPEKNSFLLLFPERSSEWKSLKQMFDAADCECMSILFKYFNIDRNGILYFPEKIIQYAGIRTSDIAIKGRGFAIEITDSNCQA